MTMKNKGGGTCAGPGAGGSVSNGGDSAGSGDGWW